MTAPRTAAPPPTTVSDATGPGGPVVIVTPWYPRPDKVYGGTFVREWVRALALPPDQVTVIHLEMVPVGDQRRPEDDITPEGRLIWLPVPVGFQLPRDQAARAQLAALTGPARAALAAAEVVFAHVTMPSGWAVTPLLDPRQRFVLVEHAAYVPQLLRHKRARPLFAEALERAESMLTAGEQTAALIRRAWPDQADKVWAVGNPIDPAAFPFSIHSPGRLDRWLYVGNLDPAKGVFEVLRAFAAYPDTNAKLTYVGQGVAEPGLRAMAAQLGAADRVEFAGGTDRAGVVAAMARSNLQIHLSPGETFGLSPLEGLLTGLPLVVARNYGTAQTMGPALAAGRAVMIDPPAGRLGAAQVVAAVKRLEHRIEQGSPDSAQRVRAAVRQRYGLAEFGEMERRVAVGLEPFEAPAADRRPLLVVALTAAAWEELADRVRQALNDRRPVTVAFGDPSLVSQFDPRIKAVALRAGSALVTAARLSGQAFNAPVAAWSFALRLAARATARAGLARSMLGRVLTRGQAGASRHRLQGRRWRSRRFEPALVKLTVSRAAAAKLAAEVRAMISQSADPTELLTAKADPPKLTRRLVREAADNSAS